MTKAFDQHQATNDGRLRSQGIVIALLSILPLIMIVFNGRDALTIVSNFTRPGAEMPMVQSSRSLTNPNPIPPSAVRATPLRFGIYDPEKKFESDSNLKIKHLYISWVNFDVEQLSTRLEELEHKGFEPLLTIEPWKKDGSATLLLTAISNGEYDEQIDQVIRAMSVLKRPALISWGHEMDQDITVRYPWSNSPAEQYIGAYRYVVDRMRNKLTVPHKWVWTGVMKESTRSYWPGASYVDFIGMPIYSFPPWDLETYGYIRDFKATFNDKKRFVSEFGKPIIITELGVNGSDDFERFWLQQAFVDLDAQSDLDSVIFFYAKDSEGVWGQKWSTPDWRVDPAFLVGLVDWKVRSR